MYVHIYTHTHTHTHTLSLSLSFSLSLSYKLKLSSELRGTMWIWLYSTYIMPVQWSWQYEGLGRFFCFSYSRLFLELRQFIIVRLSDTTWTTHVPKPSQYTIYQRKLHIRTIQYWNWRKTKYWKSWFIRGQTNSHELLLICSEAVVLTSNKLLPIMQVKR